MEIERHNSDYEMTITGSALLRIMQTRELPLMDLLVRESIQNSLDAAKEQEGHAQAVHVDFRVGRFTSSALSGHFPGIKEALDARYDSPQQFLSIRDVGTTGLTGQRKKENGVSGNLRKLVYAICERQMKHGAGGSWGMGKTVYFYIGIGLVLYYSRVKEAGQFQHRLAACLVEDEELASDPDRANSLILNDPSGIAWWGRREDPSSEKTGPVTDEGEIRAILNVFGLEPYEGDETGTTIIIPYIDEEKLLSNAMPLKIAKKSKASAADVSDVAPKWLSSLDAYLDLAIQRWYAPRLKNLVYPYGAYLEAHVQSVHEGHITDWSITPNHMYAFFRLIRELYIVLTAKDEVRREEVLGDDALIRMKGIVTEPPSPYTDQVVRLNDEAVGTIKFFQVNQRLLHESIDCYWSPRQLARNDWTKPKKNDVRPMIAYTRKPGMIAYYSEEMCANQAKMDVTSDETFIVGLFVLDSERDLEGLLPQRGKGVSQEFKPSDRLEEYIRKCEQADHASWKDLSGFGLATKIRKEISERASNLYGGDEDEENVQGGGEASRLMADILLPSTDFGKGASAPETKPKTGGKSKGSGRKNKVKSHKVLERNGDIVTFEIDLSLRTSGTLALKVGTENGARGAQRWQDPDATSKQEFPLELVSLKIKSIREAKSSTIGRPPLCDLPLLDHAHPSIEHQDFSLAMTLTKTMCPKEQEAASEACYDSIVFEKPDKQELILKGELQIRYRDTFVEGVIEFEKPKMGDRA